VPFRRRDAGDRPANLGQGVREREDRFLAERAKNVDRVEVTTTSSRKGLEFDVALLLAADEGTMPHFSSVGDQVKLDEDRRKFYASLIRARDEVHIFYSGFDDRYGRIRPNSPSRSLGLLGLTTTGRQPADHPPIWFRVCRPCVGRAAGSDRQGHAQLDPWRGFPAALVSSKAWGTGHETG
jgi:hypothetical protein